MESIANEVQTISTKEMFVNKSCEKSIPSQQTTQIDNKLKLAILIIDVGIERSRYRNGI